jgi:hypothetical protein
MTRMTCKNCRQPFAALRPTLALHCSNACRQAAYHQRLRWAGRPVMTAI